MCYMMKYLGDELMKNCIYDLVCIEDLNFYRHRTYIEKLFCKTASCSCTNCIYDAINVEDPKFCPQIEKSSCRSFDCKCSECVLFIEIEDLNDPKSIFKDIISQNIELLKVIDDEF